MDAEKNTLISRSETETENFAAELARRLAPGAVVTLNGDLGAGKTVFARGFARGLGITEPVSSPTYTIVQEYPLDGGGRLYHLDLYRINSPESALAFGVDEFFDAPDAYTLVEWAERIGGIIPSDAVNVTIIQRSENEREIRVRM